jgi:prevent-host-death family protein
MAIIRPISDLQRKIGELSRLARETKEPVYLTKNGSEYLVLLDAQTYDDLVKKEGKKK